MVLVFVVLKDRMKEKKEMEEREKRNKTQRERLGKYGNDETQIQPLDQPKRE